MKDPFEEAGVDTRRAVVIVGALAALVAVLAWWRPSVLGTVAVLGAFLVMILLHELGHLVMAKRAGMKVTEFFVGFGPRLWSVQRGETEYGLKAIPLGGYCRIIGMTNLDEAPPEDEPRTYRAKSYPQKMGVAFAGSFMHFLIATVLLFVVFVFAGNYLERRASTTVDLVEPGQPAAAAGLRAGDRIVSIDGEPVASWDEVPAIVAPQGGETVTFAVERDGREVDLDVTLAEETPSGEVRGYAGIAPTVEVPQPGLLEAAWLAPRETVALIGDSVAALFDMFSLDGIGNYLDTVRGDEPAGDAESNRFVSPLGFGRLANQAVTAGWVEVFGLLITINVFVGVFNLIPLLPFDGGHVAIGTYEAIASKVRRRKVQVDVAKLMPMTMAVIALLGFVFVTSLFLDLSNPIENPF